MNAQVRHCKLLLSKTFFLFIYPLLPHVLVKTQKKSSELVAYGAQLAYPCICVLAKTYLQLNIMSCHKHIYCYIKHLWGWHSD